MKHYIFQSRVNNNQHNIQDFIRKFKFVLEVEMYTFSTNERYVSYDELKDTFEAAWLDLFI